MLELPRALVVQSEEEFGAEVAALLRSRSPEVAVQSVSSVEHGLVALELLRPHIVFLDWDVRRTSTPPSGLLRKMSDLMEAHPGSYEYPLLINSNWRHEYQNEWSELGVTFQMENPWVVCERSDLAARDAIVRRWFARRIQPRRLLRLGKGAFDLSLCAYVRISDGPPKLHYWDLGRGCELSLDRHRDDTFQLISQQLVSSVDNFAPATARSLFVKANQRNSWANLAFVKEITFDVDGERAFVFGGGVTTVRLNITVAHVVARTLEAMRAGNLWPHLAHLEVPE